MRAPHTGVVMLICILPLYMPNLDGTTVQNEFLVRAEV